MRPFNWQEIWIPNISPFEVVFRSLAVYMTVHLVFRLLGRREWTRYTTYNVVVVFLITVALRTTIIGNDNSLTSGLVAFLTLMASDWMFSYFSYRSDRIARILQGDVVPLIKDGMPRPREMQNARVSEAQIMEQVRILGRSALDEVEDAYLERSGRISIRFKASDSAMMKK